MLMSNTRDDLLDAAEALMRKNGYSSVSYADLAERVGIRKASIHHHFPGKADLGAALVERYIAQFDTKMAAIEGQFADARRRVRAYGEIYLRSLQEKQFCLCGMLATEAELLPDAVRRNVERFFVRQTEWLAHIYLAQRPSKSASDRQAAQNAAETTLSALQGALLVAWARRDPRILARSLDAIDATIGR
jgi:TetR/AcrR family transcriptional regulator, transcriptional repressor for nem operon